MLYVVAGRCCLPLAAAVAVTVAVSRGWENGCPHRAGLDYWSAPWLSEEVGVICLRVCVGLQGPVGVTCVPGEWLSRPGAGTGELFLPARSAGRVVRMARQVAYAEATARDGSGQLVSRSTGTFLLHRAD